jgi:putative sterol carrier protein
MQSVEKSGNVHRLKSVNAELRIIVCKTQRSENAMEMEYQRTNRTISNKELLFLSEDWLDAFRDNLNSNNEYRKVAATWEGDIIFQIEADGKAIRQPIRAYMNLWHGQCLEARVGTPEDTAAFIYAGSLENWKKLILGEIGPIRGIMSRKFKVDGSIAKLMRYVKAAQVMVTTATSIPTKFPDE